MNHTRVVTTWQDVMTRDSAREVHDRVMDAVRAIDASLVLLKEQVPPDEFRNYQQAGGRLLEGLMEEFLKPLYREHDDLVPTELDRRFLRL